MTYDCRLIGFIPGEAAINAALKSIQRAVASMTAI
jgi:hypothetical protein